MCDLQLQRAVFGAWYFNVWQECINPFLASDDFSRLLIFFANSLDPDQDRQKVGPDLDPNRLTH